MRVSVARVALVILSIGGQRGHPLSSSRIGQRCSTCTPQEFLTPVVMPDLSVRGTDPSSLRLSNETRTAANTATDTQWECPFWNNKYKGHTIGLHLTGHVAQRGCI